jgi:hypothetical protein
VHPRTIITQLLGGLGNQMFQYAIGRRLAHEHALDLKVDASILLDHTPGRHLVNRDYDLDIFALQVPFASKQERRWFNPHGLSHFGKVLFHLRRSVAEPDIYIEKSFRFDEALVNRPVAPAYLAGMWQSYKYVDPIRDLLLHDFAFRHELPDGALDLAKALRDPASVCVNVRRTDFVSVPGNAALMGFVGLDYYRKAVEAISARVGAAARFFVFSDDPEWCRNELRWLPNDPVFVDHAYAGPKFSHYLHLMSMASHFVIPNSTFGWWAAWLSANVHKTVVAPRNWFHDKTLDAIDLCPPDWLLV